MDLEYVFETLQKTVIILSLPAEEQVHAMGGGHVGDEMAIDFSDFYDYRDQLKAVGWLNANQIAALEEVGRAFPKNTEMDVDFWLDQDRLYTDPVWDAIRAKAAIARAEMGLANARLDVVVEQSEPDERGLRFVRIVTKII